MLSRSSRITFYLHVLIPERGAKPLQWLPGCSVLFPDCACDALSFAHFLCCKKKKKHIKKKINQGVEFMWNKQKNQWEKEPQQTLKGVGQVWKMHLRARSHVKCGKAIRGCKASRDGFGLVTVPKDFASQTRIPTPEVQLNANHVLMGAGLQWGSSISLHPSAES